MTFLPIVDRELRVAARRPSTYYIRCGAALAILALGTWFLLMLIRESPRQMGVILFGVTTGASVFFCCLAGVMATADCLSRERRDGTLGLLFLTDLKGYDVVLGKLVAHSVNWVYAALAFLPMLAIPLLLGGTTLDQFWRMALVALNALFFSLSLGIFVSSWSRGGRYAAGTTFLLLVLITGGLPALAAWFEYKGYGWEWVRLFMLPSVGFAYFHAINPIPFRDLEYWLSMGTIHGLGWVCLGLASWIVPRTWQDRPVGGSGAGVRGQFQRWRYGGAEARKGYRRELLDRNAFYWLASRVRLKPAVVWGILALLGAGWLWGAVKFERDWLNEGIYVVTGIVLNLLVKMWVASEACRQLADERQQGTLELLLSTPLEVQDILAGQRMALWRQMFAPGCFVMLVQCVLLLAGLEEFNNRSERGVWVAVWVGSMVLLVADTVACYWVGMWQGLTAKSHSAAAGGTTMRVLIMPWLLYAGCMLVITLLAVADRRNPDPGWQFLVGLWFFLSLVVDFGFAMFARRQLLDNFRRVAAQRYARKAGLWQRLFGA